ncbi:MAG: alanine--tRNA ligase, partial [Betaproteobacteria bacterium]
YDIDLFQDLIRAAARATGAEDLQANSLKVIADHIRACSFLIADNVIPGNEGRGYVLRRIVRRAIRHGYKLGRKQPFFYTLVEDLSRVMGEAYPELPANKARIAAVLKQEEERFAETLEHGMALLEDALRREDRMLDGETVFKLYDTFGFPVDLTADIARERNIQVDFAGFEAEMQQQRERARAASKFHIQAGVGYNGKPTEFVGYESLKTEARVLALYKDSAAVDQIQGNDEAVVVLDRTPFYAESGGQVGDVGLLTSGQATFDVQATLKVQAEVFGHKGVLKTGKLSVGDTIAAQVDPDLRGRAAYNHSATHLMHAALRKVLGHHVAQKGSLVDPWKTRFDFSHNAPLTPEEIREVERLVNDQIRHNWSVEPRLMKYDEAIKAGAMALFGEKYGDEVRVIGMGEFSTELCGGTHVRRTGDIGFFKIVSQAGVAAGIRRVEAVTADGALEWVQQQNAQVEGVADMLKVQPAEVGARLHQMIENVRSLEKELGRMKSKLAASQGDDLSAGVIRLGDASVLAAVMDGADAKSLRETVDKLKDKLKSAAIVLGSVEGGKVTLIAGVTSDLMARVKAGELVNFVAQQVGGKGGGRADMAQAGGTDPAKLPDALKSVSAWVSERIAN